MSNLIKRLREDHALVYKIGWWCVILLFILLIAYFISERDVISLSLKTTWAYIITLISGILIGIMLWNGLKSDGSKSLSNNGALEIMKSGHIIRTSVFVILFMVIIGISVILLVVFYRQTNDERIAWLIRFFTETPGGLFGIVMGALTLIGTLVALQSIIEMKHTITSYPQLLDRLAELIENTDDSNDGIMIVSYFVVPGFWQDTSISRKLRLENALRNPKRKIQAICLGENEHMQMLLTIAELKNNTDERKSSKEVYEFQEKSMRILHSYAGTKYSLIDGKKALDEGKSEHYRINPVTLSWKDMPPYYFFVTDHRAIIVTPVGLPRPADTFKNEAIASSIFINNIIYQIGDLEETPKQLEKLIDKVIPPRANKKITHEQNDAQNDAQNAARGSGGDVDTLGFETTDRLIIHNLQRIFLNLKNSTNANILSDLDKRPVNSSKSIFENSNTKN